MRTARRCLVVRGAPAVTQARAEALLRFYPPEAVLWTRAPETAREGGLRARLGGTWDAVVVDLHGVWVPEVLALAEGLVRGGGALILRLADGGAPSVPGPESLVVEPYSAADVGTRWPERLRRALDAVPVESVTPETPALVPPVWTPRGSADQAVAVRALVESLGASSPVRVSLVAERGRGKSVALGQALSTLLASGQVDASRCVLTGPSADAVVEVLRFAGEAGLVFTALDALNLRAQAPEVVVVDEAAQLPVPLLQSLCARWPTARFAFATTTRGYEGTGRGFVLRFLEWVRGQAVPWVSLTLDTPIRFAPGDPVERWTREVLLLDAEPSSLAARAPETTTGVRALALDRDALAKDKARLRALFGLLVHAHYRTTPGDLHRLLDAPNLRLHALVDGADVLGASVVALEGGLSRDRCTALAAGRSRIRGHALADTLVTQAFCPAAGELRLARSVRIATHPEARRAGLARRLVEHVHAAHADVDLFGTLFGATPELVRFRRRLGYTLVRVGVSAGARTGEPAAVMVRPFSPAARALVPDLQARLAVALPVQLDLMRAEGHWHAEPALEAVLLEDLSTVPAPNAEAQHTMLEAYLSGPAPYEGAAAWIQPWTSTHRAVLETLGEGTRALIAARVLDARPWHEAAARAGLRDVPAAQRALRPALRALRDAVEARGRRA
ncbi:MAG: GNAT family N-acetyltransferase [Bradymonadia bacterium]